MMQHQPAQRPRSIAEHHFREVAGQVRDCYAGAIDMQSGYIRLAGMRMQVFNTEITEGGLGPPNRTQFHRFAAGWVPPVSTLIVTHKLGLERWVC
jgi:hypothetical protein